MKVYFSLASSARCRAGCMPEKRVVAALGPSTKVPLKRRSNCLTTHASLLFVFVHQVAESVTFNATFGESFLGQRMFQQGGPSAKHYIGPTVELTKLHFVSIGRWNIETSIPSHGDVARRVRCAITKSFSTDMCCFTKRCLSLKTFIGAAGENQEFRS